MSDKTDITFVLDRSGSMHKIKTTTIEGFNNFLTEQQAGADACVLTLNQFDDRFQTDYAAKPITEAEPLNNRTFAPRGDTALLDAIGRSIAETKERIHALPTDERPNKVIIVISTDGGENCSHEYTLTQTRNLIAERSEHGWSFIFLGSDLDGIQVARSVGIAASNILHTANNAAGACAAYATLGSNIRAARKSATHESYLRACNFTQAQQQEQDEVREP